MRPEPNKTSSPSCPRRSAPETARTARETATRAPRQFTDPSRPLHSGALSSHVPPFPLSPVECVNTLRSPFSSPRDARRSLALRRSHSRTRRTTTRLRGSPTPHLPDRRCPPAPAERQSQRTKCVSTGPYAYFLTEKRGGSRKQEIRSEGKLPVSARGMNNSLHSVGRLGHG